MDKMYLDIHLEKSLMSPSFYWHIQTAHNEKLRLPALKSAEQEVGNTGMSLAGAPSYWW